MQKIVISLVLVIFVLTYCNAQETDSKHVVPDSNSTIYFSYGLGGPIRNNNVFYAGEILTGFLELSREFSLDNYYDIETKSFLVFDSKPEHIRTDFAIASHTFFLMESQPTFTNYIAYRIPTYLIGGDYEFQVEIYDRLNKKRWVKKSTVTINNISEFGARDISLWHGLSTVQLWSPGSNHCSIGEIVKVDLNIGGLAINKSNEVSAVVSVFLIDDKTNQKLDVFKDNPMRGRLFHTLLHDEPQQFGFYAILPLTHSGHFHLEILFKI